MASFRDQPNGKMKAARYHGLKDVRIEEIEPPQAGSGKVLVKVAWCGICGSDLKNYTAGSFGTPTNDRADVHTGDYLPVTLGHEACGTIEQTVAGCPFEVGQAVMIDPRLYCTTCRHCITGDTHLCEKPGFLGLSGGGGGGFSEFIAVRWQQCYPIPQSALHTAALIEPLAVARHGLRASRISSFTDKVVLVLGGGPIGQALIYDLRANGVNRVIVSEPAAIRQQQTKAIPGVTVLDPKTTDIATELKIITSGIGADVVFDCAGVPAAMAAGLDSLRKKGTFVLIASTDKPIEISLRVWMAREISLYASLAYTDKDFGDVVADFVAGKFEGVEKMVTARITLDDFVRKGLERLTKDKGDCTKIMVTPRLMASE